MANLDFGQGDIVAPKGNESPVVGADSNEKTLKRTLSALQRGPFRFQRNNILAFEDGSNEYLFLVLGGVVRTCKTFKDGSRRVVAFYLSGDLFGWPDPHLSIEAATDAIVLFIKRGPLVSIAARDNRIGSFLLDITTNELRRAQEHALLMSRDATCRVATFLTEFSKRSKRSNCLDLPMSHQDIADHLGLTIETLSRVITGLERAGSITRESPRKLIIRNQLALERAMD